jgi:hypothetical protein
MWRKITSNRDPKDTLYSEIRREFRSYFTLLSAFTRRIIVAHSKLSFWLMVVILTISITLSFTVFRVKEKQNVSLSAKTPLGVSPVQEGIGQILETTTRIRETLAVKRLVDSLTANPKLSGPDSIVLLKALSRLEELQKPFK